jgi:(p)ppGpp synthase/HD superfamily hydrolase
MGNREQQIEGRKVSIDYRIQESYLQAYHFAAVAHQGQRYPGTDLPYIMHLSFVGMEILTALGVESGWDRTLAVQCALLHDVIEDTAVGVKQVQEAFGEAVAAGVLALSKDPAVDKTLQMADCLDRIQQQPKEIWMVKLADRISNLQPPPAHWTPEKIRRYREEATMIHDVLGSASPYLAGRLRHKIDIYER